MELTEEQKKTFDFLNRKSNEITLEKRRDVWEENAKINREFYIKGNPELPGMVAFVVGAGPSLNRNVDKLKLIPKNSRGVIIACDAALPCLFEHDITPDYCICIDGKDKMWDIVNDAGDIDTSKITLLATISASPKLIRNWKGPRYFFMNRTSSAELDAKIFYISRLHTAKRDIKKGEEIVSDDVEMVFGGVNPDLNPLGNVTGSALEVALKKFLAKKIIIIGLDLSWKDPRSFYAGRANEENAEERVNAEVVQTHPDVHGREVFTNMSLFNFKKIHEDYAKTFKGLIVNATEGGILGINEDGSRMEEMEFLSLEEAIEKYVLK
jgi:hypothetical protein